MRPALLVIAKAPVPGRVKTRLMPAVHAGAGGATRRAPRCGTRSPPRWRRRAPGGACSCLDGEPGRLAAARLRGASPQRGDGLAERLAAAFDDVGGPAFLVGMDTPQVTPELLDAGLAAVDGAATPRSAPRSTAATGASACARPTRAVFARRADEQPTAPAPSSAPGSRALGLQPAVLPPLLDVDTFADALRRRRRGAGHPLRAAALGGRWRPPRASARPTLAALGRRALRPAARLPPRSTARRRPAGARARALADGRLEPLPLDRWLAPADAVDAAVLGARGRPVLDLGCGPGRHLAALRAAGKRGLGVDLSPVAVAARPRGAAPPRSPASLFGSVPGPGRWRTVLLLDGNIGIGGAPVAAAAARRASCWRPAARSLVEVDPPGAPTHRARCGSRRRASCPSGSRGRASGATASRRSRADAGLRRARHAVRAAAAGSRALRRP